MRKIKFIFCGHKNLKHLMLLDICLSFKHLLSALDLSAQEPNHIRDT